MVQCCALARRVLLPVCRDVSALSRGATLGRFVVGGFRLGEGERRGVPFTVVLPWETPLTHLHGQALGVVLGVRTELAVAAARDKGDVDPLTVAPLPVQEAVLEAFGQLGFGFTSADLESTGTSVTPGSSCHSTRRAN